MKEIKLTKGLFALVDDDEYDKLSIISWYAINVGNTSYAVHDISKNPRSQILMHRVIAKTPKGMDTDHIDGNGLNNTRSNLRVCTRAENIRNRKVSKKNITGYLGVRYREKCKSYYAQIGCFGKSKHLGSFKDAKMAAEAYNKAAVAIYGQFARLNNI